MARNPSPELTSLLACRHPERMEVAEAISQWPDPNVTYTFMSLPSGVTLEQAIAAAEWAYGPKHGWAGVCGIKPRYVESARSARVLIGSRRIDGPGGVLADCYLPSPGVSQVNLQFDTGDDWDVRLPIEILEVIDAAAPSMPTVLQASGRAILYAVVLRHEGGHSIGLGHAPNGSPNVNAPIYDPKQLTFGTWDIQQAQARYGKPAPVVPTPTPVPTPNPGGSMGGFFGTFLIGLLKSQLEKWLADGTLQKWLEELLKRLATGQLKTVEQLTDAAEASMPLEMRASP